MWVIWLSLDLHALRSKSSYPHNRQLSDEWLLLNVETVRSYEWKWENEPSNNHHEAFLKQIVLSYLFYCLVGKKGKTFAKIVQRLIFKCFLFQLSSEIKKEINFFSKRIQKLLIREFILNLFWFDCSGSLKLIYTLSNMFLEPTSTGQ